MSPRSRFPAFAAAFVWVASTGGGCSCGEPASRARDAGRDARVQVPIEASIDADAMPEPRDADAFADVVDAARLDAAETSVDAAPLADVEELGDGAAPDAGCADGLTACPDPETGRLACVDLLRNSCHCGACNNDCLECVGGSCADCPLPVICGRGERCSAEEEFACTITDVDPMHCGACWNECAAGEICAGRCIPLFPDAGTVPDASTISDADTDATGSD